jgi:hypothetical protein
MLTQRLEHDSPVMAARPLRIGAEGGAGRGRELAMRHDGQPLLLAQAAPAINQTQVN